MFRVAAANANGTGPWSATSAAYTPHTTAPGAPTGVAGSNPTSTSIDVSWTPPADDGGSAIIRYVVQASDRWWGDVADVGYTSDDSAGWRRRVTWTGLTPGTTYLFQVVARNAVGLVAASAASAAVSTLSTSGRRRRGTWSGTAGNGQVALTWQAPSSTGGSPITGYGVDYSSDGGGTWTHGGRSVGGDDGDELHGDRADQRDAVRVPGGRGQRRGTGPWSATSAAYTPHTTAPGAPTGVAGSNATSTSIDVSWTPPANDGGSAIIRYALQRVRRWWGDVADVGHPSDDQSGWDDVYLDGSDSGHVLPLQGRRRERGGL